MLPAAIFQHLALIKKGLRLNHVLHFIDILCFQHLALIKKGLRPRYCSTLAESPRFQHLALIKKGLRHYGQKETPITF